MEIEFAWYGVKQISARLSRFADKINDYRNVFEDIAKDFYEVEKKQFSSEGARQKKWKALSPKYAAWKHKNYPGRSILVLSGDLRDSLISEGGDNIKVITKNKCILGTSDPKGKWHSLGSRRLPVRRVIDLNPKDKTRWVKKIHEHIWHMCKILGLIK